MQRTVPIVLAEDQDLRATIQAFGDACAAISPAAFNAGSPFSAVALQRVVYADVKARGLSAQLACSAIRRVAGAYASAKSNKRPAIKPFAFARPVGLWLIGKRGRDASVRPDGVLAVWTLAGRKHVAFRVPERHCADFDAATEYDALQVTLDRRGRLRATLAVTLPDVPAKGTVPVGIDLNETNVLVAVDPDERDLFISGKETRVRNRRTFKTKKRLQRKLAALKAQKRATKSVGRALKRLGRKQRRRTLDLARCSAKKLCAWAPKDAVLVIEDLKLPQPTKARKPGASPKRVALRRRLSTFAYLVFRTAIASRAARVGMAVVAVDPRNTSQRCARCGLIGERRRHQFVCPHCGHLDHADRNAARNIRALYQAQPRRVGRRQSAPKPLREASPGP